MKSTAMNQVDQNPFESALATLLRSEEEVITADCIEPDDLMALIEQGSSYPGADALLNHMVHCAFCRNHYREIRTGLSLAGQLRHSGTQRTSPEVSWSASSPTSYTESVVDDLEKQIAKAREQKGTTSTDPTRSVRFNWGALAAAEAVDETEVTGLFCEGALKVTLWLDGELVVLAAENDPTGIWRWNEAAEPEIQEEESAISLAGQVIQYHLTGSREDIKGFFVLPMNAADVFAAEVSLGLYREFPSGEVDCRVASPDELADADLVRRSIGRSRNRSSRRAWKELLEHHGRALPEDVRSAILEATS